MSPRISESASVNFVRSLYMYIHISVMQVYLSSIFSQIRSLSTWTLILVCNLRLRNVFHVESKLNLFSWWTELYYGGEAFTADQPQSFTCPYCGKMGFTESALQEHVASEHSDASIEVVSIWHMKYFWNTY